MGRDLAARADAIGLQAGEFRHKRLAFRGGEKKALTAVGVARLLHNIAFIKKLLQHSP